MSGRNLAGPRSKYGFPRRALKENIYKMFAFSDVYGDDVLVPG